jgi:hypothetical protein
VVLRLDFFCRRSKSSTAVMLVYTVWPVVVSIDGDDRRPGD